ncbi:hypothetical protein HYR99_40560 [Candidatus Poribacteria bacterium]|nr:hypothetical protein [Candidatus Poribacteria bacterium]
MSGPYDLSATAGDRGGWQLGVRLREGERQTLSLTLKEAISLSGNVLALDNTPHAAIAVQVVTPAPLSLDERHLPSPRGRGAGGEGEPTVVATTLSEESGRYRFINLLPGRYQVRVYTGDGDVYYGFLPPLSSPRGRGNKNSLPPSPRPLLSPRPRGDHRGGGEGWGGGKTLQVQPGKTLSNIDFRVAPFKKGIWKTYNVLDGLAHNSVTSIYQDKAGAMWFGTGGGGVSRYDGMTWTSFDTRDGLAGNIITLMHQDSAGFLWLATVGGISRYRRRMTTPYVQIFSVRTDALFTKMDSIPLLNPRRITAGKRVSIEYNSIDFQTLPSKRQYRVKMSKSANEQMSKWLPPTKETTFDWTPKQPGQYRFEVQAIDGEHNDSEPAALTLKVVRPWWVYALWGTIGIIIPVAGIGFYYGKRLQTQRAIAQQFNPYIAGRVVGTDLFYGRSDILTDIERTLANNCFLIYGERRIGKTSLQHQLKERLQKADDPTYKFVPAYIDLQGVAEDDFFRTIAAGVVEACRPLSPSPPVGEGRGEGEGTPLTPGPSPTRGEGELALRLNEARDGYTYRDLTRDLRTIIDHLKANETKAIKIVLLMDEVDTLNTYSLRTNLNLRGLFMGPLKENLVLVMSGLYLKMDWSAEGGGSPPFNFLSREIQIQPLDEESARKLITEPIKGFYSYEPKAIDQIIELSELRPFTIQGFCLRAVNRVLADGRTKITLDDIEAIKESVLAEVNSIRGERAGTSLPASFNEALSVITDLKAEVARLRGEAA